MSFVNVTPYRQNIRPGFVGDFLNREHVLPGGIKLNLSTFISADAIRVQANGAAAAGATTVTVDPLPGAVPNGAVLQFGASNSTKFARLTDDSPAGDTTLTVAPLPTTLADNDVAFYNEPGAPLRIPAGTPVFISQAALEAGAASGVKWSYAGNNTAVAGTDVVRILAFDVTDDEHDGTEKDDADILRKGTLIRVNHMYWSTLHSTVQDKIRADYEVTVGTPGQEVPAS